MRTFRFEAATDVEAAVRLLATSAEPKLLGGGTNLVDLMKLGVERPATLIDVSRLGLDAVTRDDDGTLHVGAGVRNSDLAAHPDVRRGFPVLSQALLAGATGQLRNMATTGGNLLQRTRCVYFQDVGKPCNKRRPGTGCSAREGEHRNHAVLGVSSECIATHPSDMAVALTALDTRVEIAGGSGRRAIALDELYRLPGANPDREYTLAPDEVITGVTVPALPTGTASAYRKVRDRASYAFALVSVAAAVRVEVGVLQDVRIGLGGVAHKPWRATRAEDVLRGNVPDIEAFRAAAEAELADAQPLRDNAYKLPLVTRVLTATLAGLTGTELS